MPDFSSPFLHNSGKVVLMVSGFLLRLSFCFGMQSARTSHYIFCQGRRHAAQHTEPQESRAQWA